MKGNEKNRFEKESDRLLLLLFTFALVLFSVLYISSQSVIEAADPVASFRETRMQNQTGDLSLKEYGDFYEQDSNLYDVYISVFPTPNENGEVLDYSAFAKHQARDHSYNPLLNCNIQILSEGQTPDPLTSLDQKNATIRVRGNTSRGAAIKSYKVKLDDEAGTFKGQTSLNINKHKADNLKLTTKLQTDLLTQVSSLPSFQTYFMRVWVRDCSKEEDDQTFEYQGLFTEIEQPNKKYIEKRGLSSQGSLYKAENFAFQPSEEIRNTDDPAYDPEAFENRLSILEGGNDHSTLLNAIEAVNDPTKDFQKVMDQYFDEDNFLTWLSFNLLVRNADTLSHNYILYTDGYSEKVYFIPWDFDGGLQMAEPLNENRYPFSQQSIQRLNTSPVVRRYLRLEGSDEKIRSKMKELLDGPLKKENIQSLLDSYMPVMEKTLPSKPDIDFMPISLEEWQTAASAIPDFIHKQLNVFDQTREYPAPFYVALPERNTDGSLTIVWDPSYSYQQRTLTYTVEIFKDYEMKNKVYEKKGIAETSVTTDQKFESGSYFVKVSAVDSAGNGQMALEHYEFKTTEGRTIYVSGLLQFTV